MEELNVFNEVRLDIEAVVFRCTCPDRGVSTHNGQPCPNAEEENLGVIASSDDNSAVLNYIAEEQ